MDIVLVKELVAAGVSLSFVAQATEGGYTLLVRTPNGARLLAAQRGHPRVFKKLDTVASTLADVGAQGFEVHFGEASEFKD